MTSSLLDTSCTNSGNRTQKTPEPLSAWRPLFPRSSTLCARCVGERGPDTREASATMPLVSVRAPLACARSPRRRLRCLICLAALLVAAAQRGFCPHPRSILHWLSQARLLASAPHQALMAYQHPAPSDPSAFTSPFVQVLLVLLRSQYLRALQRGEHRVLHAVVESVSIEISVNLGSIDTVSHAPRSPAPCDTLRSCAVCLARKP